MAEKHFDLAIVGSEYIEVTRNGVATANRLAHAVLGRSLASVPPQTRRRLGLLLEMVSDKALAQGIDRSEAHFTRREVRERLGWGPAQRRCTCGDSKTWRNAWSTRAGARGSTSCSTPARSRTTRSTCPGSSRPTPWSSPAMHKRATKAMRVGRGSSRIAPKLFETPTSPSSIMTQAVVNQVIETMSTAALRSASVEGHPADRDCGVPHGSDWAEIGGASVTWLRERGSVGARRAHGRRESGSWRRVGVSEHQSRASRCYGGVLSRLWRSGQSRDRSETLQGREPREATTGKKPLLRGLWGAADS